jgi:hypothetical protein
MAEPKLPPVGLEALFVGSLMCLASVYFPLAKRGLVTTREVEEALALFSEQLAVEEANVSKTLHESTPAGAKVVLTTFQMLINPESPAPTKPPWLRGVFPGGKS